MSQAPEVTQEVHLTVPPCPAQCQKKKQFLIFLTTQRGSIINQENHINSKINNCHGHTSNAKVPHTPSPHFSAALEHRIEHTHAIIIFNSSYTMYLVFYRSYPPSAIIGTNSGTGIPRSPLQHSLKENNQEWGKIHDFLFKNADQQSAQSIRITWSRKEWRSNETS